MKHIKLPLLFVLFSRVVTGFALLHYGLSYAKPFQIAVLFGLFCCYLLSWLPSDTALAGLVVFEKMQLMQTFLQMVRNFPQQGSYHNTAYNDHRHYSPYPNSFQLPNHRNETLGTQQTIHNQPISLKRMGEVSGVPYKLYSNGSLEFDGRLWSEQQLKDNLRTAQSQLKDPKRKNAKGNYEKFSALLDILNGVVPNNSTTYQNDFTIHH